MRLFVGLRPPEAFVPHITPGRKPIVPEGFDLSGIVVPAAEMTVSDVFLYRSERGENGMIYSVVGKGAKAIRQSEPA